MKKFPYAESFIDFQKSLTAAVRTAQHQAVKNTETTRTARHKATVRCLAKYNAILTQLQEAGIKPAKNKWRTKIKTQ